MKSISRKGVKQGCGCIPFGIAVIFLIAGSSVFVLLSGVPIKNWLAAQTWAPVPCEILDSEVRTHNSSDGTTYSVAIAYRYEFDGTTYHGDRYNFLSGSSSGLSRKEAIVAKYPAGAERTCFVNPASPGESVLSRTFHAGYLIGTFGLIFVAIALGLVFFSRKQGVREGISGGGRLQPPAVQADYAQGTITLEGGKNSLIGCVALFLIMLVWNGIVGTVIWSVTSESSVELFPLLFMIPFALVGLALIGGFGYFFLSMFNPRPDVTLTPGYLPLGGSAVLAWSFRGNPSRIRSLTITLCGQEKATYRRGTTTTTDTKTFEEIPLVTADAPGSVARGEVRFTIPEFTAPSFDAPNNKIVWVVKVHGDIRRWPDVNEEFEVTVSPLPRERTGDPVPAEFHLI